MRSNGLRCAAAGLHRLGLFLQHEARLPEARTVLEEGLTVMDPVHPDAIIGRSHLGAVLDGRTCGCGDMAGTIADAFREFVITRLPADLLDRLDVAIVGVRGRRGGDGGREVIHDFHEAGRRTDSDRRNGNRRSSWVQLSAVQCTRLLPTCSLISGRETGCS
ncbi:hypothetical protein [Micromonospora sp. NPDC005299]|uniref:hypothetical protein n=1 Tax=Micromonospora sp. NPDC005299 TaxID=3364231 RepID=UPI0036BFD794